MKKKIADILYNKTSFIYLVLFLNVMNIFDAVLTWIFVGKNMAVEVNPVMKWVIQDLGWTSFFAIKVGIILLSVGILQLIWAKTKKASFVINPLIVCCSIYFLLACLHIYNINQLSHFVKTECLSHIEWTYVNH